MCNLNENIFALCNERGITPGALCGELGFRRSVLSDLKNGRKKSLDTTTLMKIAEHFNVSVDYLLTGEETKKAPDLTEKDERDIERRLSAMIADLSGPTDGLMFDGEPIDDETRQLLEVSLRNQLEISKRIAKQKYTPKKYRKEGE